MATDVPRIITPDNPALDAGSEAAANSLMFGTPKERLDFYRREIHHETSMLSNRTNAYLYAQSFMVIAYASSMSNMNEGWGDLFTLVVPTLLVMLGIINSLHAWPGIKASVLIIGHWHFKQEQLLQSDTKFGDAYDESPLFSERESSKDLYRKSLLFYLRSPWLFAGFWLTLGLFSFWLQLSTARI